MVQIRIVGQDFFLCFRVDFLKGCPSSDSVGIGVPFGFADITYNAQIILFKTVTGV
jgi:hypothetical protein